MTDINFYKITFESGGETHEYIRKAETAYDAAKILAGEFGLTAKVDLIDADYRGKEWAKVSYWDGGGKAHPEAVVMVEKITIETASAPDGYDPDEEITWFEATSVFPALSYPGCSVYVSDNERVKFIYDNRRLAMVYIDGIEVYGGGPIRDADRASALWTKIVNAAFGEDADNLRKYERDDEAVALYYISECGCSACPYRQMCESMDETVS